MTRFHEAVHGGHSCGPCRMVIQRC